MVTPGADTPPPERPGWALLRRFAVGAVIIVALSATTVASAVLLEVREVARVLRDEGPALAPAVSSLLANVAPGRPQTIIVNVPWYLQA